jgi:hypothetical protein
MADVPIGFFSGSRARKSKSSMSGAALGNPGDIRFRWKKPSSKAERPLNTFSDAGPDVPQYMQRLPE